MLPRLPVFGWHMFSGQKHSDLGCVTDHAQPVVTTSGRAAILLALRTLGVTSGSRVLVPTYHCPTMIAPAAVLGATPVFYPLTPRGGPDLAWLRRLDTRGVRAMLAAHFFGIPQPMHALRNFCDARGIALIEDCAHAFFGMSDGRNVGAWGDFAIASLTKFFPVNEGGLLLTQRATQWHENRPTRSLTDEARSLVDALEIGARHGAQSGAKRLLAWAFQLKNQCRQRPHAPGHTPPPNPMNDPELARPSRPMTRTAQWLWAHAHQARIVTRRRHHYTQLVAMLSGVPGMSPLFPRLPEHCAPYVMPLKVEHPDALYHALRQAGIPVFRWCQLWPDTPRIEGDSGLEWSTKILQLGCHQDLDAGQIAHIADSVKRLAGA